MFVTVKVRWTPMALALAFFHAEKVALWLVFSAIKSATPIDGFDPRDRETTWPDIVKFEPWLGPFRLNSFGPTYQMSTSMQKKEKRKSWAFPEHLKIVHFSSESDLKPSPCMQQIPSLHLVGHVVYKYY